VTRFGCGIVVAALAFGPAGCLLYTDPINMPPTIAPISEPTTAIVRRKAALFRTVVSDDQDAARVTIEWREGPRCPGDLAEAEIGPGDPSERLLADGIISYETTRATMDAFCVWVVARDQHGARAFRSLAKPIAPTNQTPIPHIRVTEVAAEPPPSATITSSTPAPATSPTSFPLYSALSASAAMSKDPDGDKLSFAWTLADLANREIAPLPCKPGEPAASGREVCLTAATPGGYRIRLEIADELGARATAEAIAMVDDDRPPCIKMTEPATFRILHDPAQPTRFRVTFVDDDGDRYPTGATAGANPFPFVWSRRNGTQGPFIPMVCANDCVINANTFARLDIAQVRVEYQDRVPRNLAGACSVDAALCELAPGKSCYQWVTWTVDYRLGDVR
jgi:hypothetical protein